MRRPLAGLLLVAHGMAHTLAGMRGTEGAHPWLLTLAWGAALVGFAGAGLGLLGVRAMRPAWRRLAAAGVVGSVVLLAVGWPTPLAAVGLLVDGLVVCLVLYFWNRESPGTAAPPRRPAARALELLAIAALVWLAVLVAARPWHMRWGSTPAELQAGLPGDDTLLRPTYQIQHAVSVDAAPDRIWPWLVQLGEDRGGFYSYAWLERIFGFQVHNADRIHPEWQRLAPGDTVFATHVGWLGQRRRLGWRVGEVRPDTVLVLENWGSFVLLPVGAGSTRLIARTRGAGPDGIKSVVLAPLGFALFEPVHFIMQRKMLLTLKERAERGRAPASR